MSENTKDIPGAVYIDLVEEIRAMERCFADSEPLGWTTWPLALAEEAGKVARAVLHRKTQGVGDVRMYAVTLAAASIRFIMWMDRMDAKKDIALSASNNQNPTGPTGSTPGSQA